MYTRNCWAAFLLLGLLTVSSSFVFAQNTQSAAQESTDRAPTLQEIAKANEAVWEAIKSVDMVYDLTSQIVTDGRKGREVRSTDIRWSKEGNRERLRRCFRRAELADGDFGTKETCEYEDCFLDGKIMMRITDADPENKDKGKLSCLDQKGLHAEISPESSRLLTVQERSPELLSNLHLWISPPLTLSELIATCKVTLKEKQTTQSGDVLWLIHTEPLREDGDNQTDGSYSDIQVNASKGFWIQKVLTYFSDDGAHRRPVGVYFTLEIQEFQDCGHGVFFPKRVQYHLMGETEQGSSGNGLFITQTATKLAVNTPLPNDAFDFRFPENILVQQQLQADGSSKLLLWGADNKPAKEFNTDEEFNTYADHEALDLLRQRVEEHSSSKEPTDLVERGVYHLQTKNYDAAIAAFSDAISSDPKMSDALFFRGMVYLCHKQDSTKAIADFTEVQRLDTENENAAMSYYLRGLAYASQNDGLEKAVADLTEALQLDPNVQECLAGAYLVRSIDYARKGNLADALSEATKAIEADPKNADAYSVRCCVYEKKGDQDKAKGDREAAKQLQGETSASNEVERAFADALHRTLLQLVPDLE